MKKSLATLLFLVQIILASAQTISIPDTNFLRSLIENRVDRNRNKKIEASEAKAVKNLTVFGKEIQSVKGIEAFTQLDSLVLVYSSIKEVDLSQNKKLRKLNLLSNKLEHLEIQDLPLLKEFACVSNQLRSLVVKDNPSLFSFNCSNNLLRSLALGNNPSLYSFDCSYNLLDSLDASSFPHTSDVNFSHNKLTSLVLKDNPSLLWFNCSDNLLDSLDISGVPQLISMNCSRNNLKSLDLRNNNELGGVSAVANQIVNVLLPNHHSNEYGLDLSLYDNRITSLDLNTLPNLRELNVGYNLLTSLNLTACSRLFYLETRGNKDLRTICISGLLDRSRPYSYPQAIQYDPWTRLNENCLWISENCLRIPDPTFYKALIRNGVDQNKDGCIQLEEAKAVDSLNVSSSYIRTLNGIKAFTNLRYFNCDTNDIYEFDLSNFPFLAHISCRVNQDKSYFPATAYFATLPQLRYLDCSRSHIAHLSLPDSPLLEHLDLSHNRLKGLYLPKHSLSFLNCSNNYIDTLPKVGPALKWLDCSYNGLNKLSIPSKSSLEYLDCSANWNIDSLNLKGCRSLKKLYCHSNSIRSLILYDKKDTTFQTLVCSWNNLSKLDVSNFTHLGKLWCYNNNPALQTICVADVQRALSDPENFRKEPTAEWREGCWQVLGTEESRPSSLSLQVFPNPARDIVHISEEAQQASLFTLEGKRLSTQSKTKEVNISALPTGIFLLEIDLGQGKKVFQIIIKED